MRRIYNQLFPEGKLKEAVYVEGQGTPIAWRRPYNLFGSEGVYPDIAHLKTSEKCDRIESFWCRSFSRIEV